MKPPAEPKYRKLSSVVEEFRVVCRTHGYALAVHGNPESTRDVDCIAVPWTPKAIESGTLIKWLADIEGVIVGTPSGKPHGRIAVTYTLRVMKHRPGRRSKPHFIDLSITPRQGDW